MNWKLSKHPGFAGVPGPVVACVMDGVGIGRRDDADAVWLARTPHLDALAQGALATSLAAHGKAVGMPTEPSSWERNVPPPRVPATRPSRSASKVATGASGGSPPPANAHVRPLSVER
jgi:2,3-bisphosphoglycerate-independent phosphoglycerate mutase